MLIDTRAEKSAGERRRPSQSSLLEANENEMGNMLLLRTFQFKEGFTSYDPTMMAYQLYGEGMPLIGDGSDGSVRCPREP